MIQAVGPIYQIRNQVIHVQPPVSSLLSEVYGTRYDLKFTIFRILKGNTVNICYIMTMPTAEYWVVPLTHFDISTANL